MAIYLLKSTENPGGIVARFKGVMFVESDRSIVTLQGGSRYDLTVIAKINLKPGEWLEVEEEKA